MSYDVIIRGGTVVDGTGAAPRTADVAVADGVIVEVGRVERYGAAAPSTPTGSPSHRDSSTSTPTSTARPPGIRTSRRRAGTASPPRSWATAASASRPCGPIATTG